MDRFGFFYWRMPLLSFQEIIDLLASGDLKVCLLDQRVREAIFLASHSFDQQLQADPLLTNPDLQLSFLKYILRMGSRPTPFGLFAGCSLGYIGTLTSANVDNREVNCRYSLDSRVLWQLAHHLVKLPLLQPFLRFHPNTSLYKIGASMRYVEVVEEKGSLLYFTSELEGSTLLNVLLNGKTFPQTIPEMETILLQKGYDLDEIRLYLNQLIDDQLLVSDLAINVTGIDYVNRLIKHLAAIPGTEDLLQALIDIQTTLQSQQLTLSQKQAAIRDLIERRIEVPLGNIPLLRGDTVFSEGHLQLASNQTKHLQGALEKLFVLSAQHTEPVSLVEFKQAFYQRYEEQEVPLLLAFDIDSGVGYNAYSGLDEDSFIEELIADQQSQENGLKGNSFSEVDQWLHTLYDQWLETDQESLIVSDQDLVRLPPIKQKLPLSYYTLGYFLASSAQAIDAGAFLFRAKVIAGPTAFPLLGRFAATDDELSKLIKHTFDQQQANEPDRIYAEIVHLPNGLAGNVIQRPIFSDYEIPYLGYSTLPPSQQITVDDLLISVPHGKRVVLRSKRLGKEIIPRLTTAHNYQSGLPIYRFLCDLQQQEGDLSISWSWGRLTGRRFLPRVQYRNVILQEARWRLEWQDYDPRMNDTDNVTYWRGRWRWPRYIALVQGDQELLIDLESHLCVKLLVDTVRRLKTVVVIEWLQIPDQCFIDSPKGKFTHEAILPFYASQTQKEHRNSWLSQTKDVVNRTFLPGSEWVYLKVYCGRKIANKVLAKLGKVARAYRRSHQITHWFFIRYQDPDPYLRFRFHLNSLDYFAGLLNECYKQLGGLLNSGEIHRIQLDTYKRELERYGPSQIESIEWCFWADSDAVFSVLQNKIARRSKLYVALYGIDSYFSLLDFTIKEKLDFSHRCFSALFIEHGAQQKTRKQLANLYRSNERLVMALLLDQVKTVLSERDMQIFVTRNKRFLSILQLNVERKAALLANLGDIIHLFVNRLFDQHQRTYELLVYHHLSRGYQSIIAKAPMYVLSDTKQT
jgi:thiopeptide-type bacteriocin biosynthesis protein